MGVPTINVYPTDRLLPPRGVYATRVKLGGSTYDSVSNLGVRPSFADDDRVSLESFLFGDPGDISEGTPVETTFVAFIRPERRFESPDELVAQIRRDTDAARAALLGD
jgi:riboflavin kinase/FMN adenylyltransferase